MYASKQKFVLQHILLHMHSRKSGHIFLSHTEFGS